MIQCDWVCQGCGIRFIGGFDLSDMYSLSDYYYLVHGEYCYGFLHRTTKEVTCVDCFA